jgi:hypothetical protein
MVPAVRDAEHAFHCTDGTADAGTDGTSDHATHRTGNAVALVGALLGAAHDALGVAGMRQRRQGEQRDGGSQTPAEAKLRRKGKTAGNAAAAKRVLFISIPKG